MPGSFNGFGTTFYGERGHAPDGSYVTTEWIILLYLPIIPLRSLRIARNPQDDFRAVAFESESYYVISRERLCWTQVFLTYGFIFGTIAWCLGLFLGYTKLPDNWKKQHLLMIVIGSFVAAAPFFLLLWMRHRSKKAPLKQLPTAMPGQNRDIISDSRL